MSYKEQRDYETIDQKMEQLQKDLEELDRQIEQNASDFVKLTELTQKREAAQQALDEAEERWLYLTIWQNASRRRKRVNRRACFPRERHTLYASFDLKGGNIMKRRNKAILAAGMLAGSCALDGMQLPAERRSPRPARTSPSSRALNPARKRAPNPRRKRRYRYGWTAGKWKTRPLKKTARCCCRSSRRAKRWDGRRKARN